jgi:hypothetical protein
MRELRFSRRTLTATGVGIATGVFAMPFVAAGQDATPAALVPAGYVSTRVRTVSSADARSQINERVLSDFAPTVAALPGYGAYVLADVIDQDNQSVSVVVFNQEADAAGFDEAAKTFVASLGDLGGVTATEQWAGDLLMQLGPTGSGTPEAEPATATPATSGVLALRVHTSKEGTDPRDFVPLATADFLPLIKELPGVLGYLWYPIDGGFVAISMFDSLESAQASNEAAKGFAAEYLAKFTDGNPVIVNSNIVYADLPILG